MCKKHSIEQVFIEKDKRFHSSKLWGRGDEMVVGQKIIYLICFIVIAIAVTGYSVGLQSPMNSAGNRETSALNPDYEIETYGTGSTTLSVIAATHYSEMNRTTLQPSRQSLSTLSDLQRNVDPLAKIEITPEQKAVALTLREQNRAFNGAPPTIPHGVEQMSVESCMACHGEGFKSESLRISRMSHQFLTNCTQCHVENNSLQQSATLFRKSTFIGLPAPKGGPRAYAGAPPMIPHTTWMRVNCVSCHGFSSELGIRTTHPWRQNCQQCHAPSSVLDQIPLDSKPKFLASPNIRH